MGVERARPAGCSAGPAAQPDIVRLLSRRVCLVSLIALNLLWLLPVVVYLAVRRLAPARTWQATGIALGLIAAPASLGLYSLYYVHPLVALLGIPGLLLGMFHASPGYNLGIMLDLVEPGTVVRGATYLHITALNAIVWSLVYGAVGYSIDQLRRRSRT